MNRKLNFVYTFFEVLSTLLVLFGLSQFSDNISGWQYGLFNSWSGTFWFISVILTFSIIAGGVWHMKDPNRESQVHRFLETFIAFYVAYMIFGYAFAKLLKTQFQAPNYVLDTPIGELNGFWLTWTYFGFSQTFAYILGWTQILGCVLLLFRKTRLLGTFVLIPVMVNICLIDHFYSISPLAYFNALHYTFLLCFILSLDAPKLIALFFGTENSLKYTNWKFWTLNGIRLLVVLLAFNRIYSLKASFQPKTKINGVWQMEKIRMGGKDVIAPDQKFALSKVYFEWRYGCVFKLDASHDCPLSGKQGQYALEEKNTALKINLYPTSPDQSKGDSLLLQYYFTSDSLLTLTGFYNRDSIQMDLRKLK